LFTLGGNGIYYEVMSSANRKKIISVIGAGVCNDDIGKLAEEVGRRIAEEGAILLCGGLGGVMEHAARGAKSAGGMTIGIIPTYDPANANPFIDIPILTGLGHARNVIVVSSADAVISVGGEYGTLSELAIALKLGRPTVGLKTWELPRESRMIPADTPEAAVTLALREISKT